MVPGARRQGRHRFGAADGPWPQGFDGPFDAVSALNAVGTAAALFRFKAGVMPLLAACALLGLSISLTR